MLIGYNVQLGLETVGYPYNHLHEHYELTIVMKENICFKLGDIEYRTNVGDVILIPPYYFHCFDSAGVKYDTSYIFFDEFATLKRNASLQPAFEYIRKNGLLVLNSSEEDLVVLTQMFVDAYNNFMDTNDFMYDFKNTQSLGNILYYVIEKDIKKHASSDTLCLLSIHKEEFYQRILVYISEHINENLKTKDILEEFGIGKTTLYKILKSTTGMSFKELVIQIRIARACDLLLQDYSITEISNMVGFNSYSHFIKIFKQKMGYTPQQYKRHLRDYVMIADEKPCGLPINHLTKDRQIPTFLERGERKNSIKDNQDKEKC